jgi:hypothetical protein
MTVEGVIDDPRDQFPIGMRVLAVDDDPTCLFLLETLLRRCQYHGLLLSLLCFALSVFRYGVLDLCFVIKILLFNIDFFFKLLYDRLSNLYDLLTRLHAGSFV